jgi:putative resolvase
MEKRYKKLSEYAKERSVTYRTAWNHYKSGKIPGAFADDLGNILIPIFKSDKDNKDIKVSIYARVSSNDRKNSLDEQLNRLTNYSINNGYKIIHSIKEIGSGMNDSRNKLEKLLLKDDWDVLIIENKDRLTRFGFNYIELLLNKMGKEIIVVNESDNDKEDLMKDLISIIYSFSARMYGLRRRKNKQEIIDFIKK